MTTHPSQPAKVGKYEVERILGRGAMGLVYLARDPMIGRHIALKTIHLPAGLDQDKVHEFRTRFLREAQAAGRLNHPNLVTIYEADDGSAGGPPFIAMEYIQGDTWSARVKRGEKAHADHLLPQVMEIAEALAYAHKQNVVHRDIKPANIITTPDGRAKLMDFGIARVPTSELTQEGQFLGTPAYMSPEQILGKPVDGRSDLFSLGTVIFEMITGLKPFSGEEVHAVTHKILQAPPEPLPERIHEIPPPVAWILNRLMAKKPEDRYNHAGELVDDLRAYLHGALPPYASQGAAAESTQVNAPTGAGVAPLPTPEPKPPSPVSTLTGTPEATPAAAAPPPRAPAAPVRKKNTGLLVVGFTFMALLMLGVAGGGLWWWTRRGAPPDETQAQETPVETTEPAPTDPIASPPPQSAAPAGPDSSTKPASTPPQPPKPKPAAPAATGPAATHPGAGNPTPASAGTSRLDFTFSAGVLKGEYWLKVDGQTSAHGVIDRKFTFKTGEWTGTCRVPAGKHTIRFELKTDIQDLVVSHEEAAEFAAGAGRTLDIKLHKVRKELEFAWR